MQEVAGVKSKAKPNRWSVRELACWKGGKAEHSQPLEKQVPGRIPGDMVNDHTWDL